MDVIKSYYFIISGRHLPNVTPVIVCKFAIARSDNKWINSSQNKQMIYPNNSLNEYIHFVCWSSHEQTWIRCTQKGNGKEKTISLYECRIALKFRSAWKSSVMDVIFASLENYKIPSIVTHTHHIEPKPATHRVHKTKPYHCGMMFCVQWRRRRRRRSPSGRAHRTIMHSVISSPINSWQSFHSSENEVKKKLM